MPVFDVIGRIDKWKKGDVPMNPMVSIALVSYHTMAYSEDSKLITEELASEEEIEIAVERLILDLKKAGTKAKKKLKKDNEKMDNRNS